MKITSISYISTNEFNDPHLWLKRIGFYTGILEKLAMRHEVVSIERINYEGSLEKNGVRYFFLKLKKKTSLFPFRIHRLAKSLQPDVVLVNSLIFPLQVMQLRWKLGKRVKIIILHRAEKPFKGLKKYLQKLADSCVDGYLFTSREFGKEWIKNGIIKDEKKIHEVIQASSEFMYASRSAARSTLNITGSRIYLWVGRLDSNKDPLTVVKAFIEFLAVEPDASLYMIYQKKDLLPEIMELVNTQPIAKNRIKFIGNIAHDNLQDWYNSADFIISGSHYEGSGIAVSEAMSCGCIPLVTNIASFRKMTGPGKCGMLYEPGNTSALFFCLKKTLELNIGEEKNKVLLQFQQELSFDAIANKINKIIGDTG